MLPSTDVFDLIQTLSQAEKRYFRVQASQHVLGEENLYLRIFDLIREMPVYDEEALKAALDDPKHIRNLSNSKNYLFGLLLRSLRLFHAGNAVDAQLRDQVQDLRTLLQRRVVRPFPRLFRAAWELAQRYERLAVCLDLLDLERRYLRETAGAAWEQHLTRISEQRHALHQRMLRIHQVEEVHDRLYLASQKYYRLRDTAPVEALRLQLEALPAPQEDDPFLQQLLTAQAQALWHTLQQQPGPARQAYFTQVNLVRRYPIQMHHDPLLPLRVRANYLAACHLEQDFSAFPDVLAEMEAFVRTEPVPEEEVFGVLRFYQLLHALVTADFAAGLPFGRQVLKRLPALRDALPRSRYINFYYNLAIFFFFAGEWKQALDCVNALLREEKSGLRVDLVRFSRILLLVLHVELGNFELTEYLFRSLYRFLYRQRAIGRFERALLDFLRNIHLLEPGPALRPYLESLDTALEALRTDPAEMHSPGLQETRLWIQARLHGIPLREVATAWLRQHS